MTHVLVHITVSIAVLSFLSLVLSVVVLPRSVCFGTFAKSSKSKVHSIRVPHAHVRYVMYDLRTVNTTKDTEVSQTPNHIRVLFQNGNYLYNEIDARKVHEMAVHVPMQALLVSRIPEGRQVSVWIEGSEDGSAASQVLQWYDSIIKTVWMRSTPLLRTWTSVVKRHVPHHGVAFRNDTGKFFIRADDAASSSDKCDVMVHYIVKNARDGLSLDTEGNCTVRTFVFMDNAAAFTDESNTLRVYTDKLRTSYQYVYSYEVFIASRPGGLVPILYASNLVHPFCDIFRAIRSHTYKPVWLKHITHSLYYSPDAHVGGFLSMIQHNKNSGVQEC
eukprot:PhF_6_TR31375/c0_g1_i1/m.45947